MNNSCMHNQRWFFHKPFSTNWAGKVFHISMNNFDVLFQGWVKFIFLVAYQTDIFFQIFVNYSNVSVQVRLAAKLFAANVATKMVLPRRYTFHNCWSHYSDCTKCYLALKEIFFNWKEHTWLGILDSYSSVVGQQVTDSRFLVKSRKSKKMPNDALP